MKIRVVIEGSIVMDLPEAIPAEYGDEKAGVRAVQFKGAQVFAMMLEKGAEQELTTLEAAQPGLMSVLFPGETKQMESTLKISAQTVQ